MIHVKFSMDWKTMTVSMDVQGHAMMAAPREEEPVRAAVMALVYTLAQAVQFLYEQDLLLERPQVRICDGYASIIARPRKSAQGVALMPFWTIQAGFYVLERNFPKRFSLISLEFSRG